MIGGSKELCHSHFHLQSERAITQDKNMESEFHSDFKQVEKDHGAMSSQRTKDGQVQHGGAQWLDRSCSGGRPSIYDRYYTKWPGNLQVLETPRLNSKSFSSINLRMATSNHYCSHHRLVTEADVRRIERRLSLKKTLRKQCMRDLSQAPNIAVDNEEDKKEDKKECSMGSSSARLARSSVSLLQLLKESSADTSDDSGIGNNSPPMMIRGQTKSMDQTLLKTHVTIPRARWSTSDWERLEMAHQQVKRQDEEEQTRKKMNKVSRLKSFLHYVKANHNKTR